MHARAHIFMACRSGGPSELGISSWYPTIELTCMNSCIHARARACVCARMRPSAVPASAMCRALGHDVSAQSASTHVVLALRTLRSVPRRICTAQDRLPEACVCAVRASCRPAQADRTSSSPRALFARRSSWAVLGPARAHCPAWAGDRGGMA